MKEVIEMQTLYPFGAAKTYTTNKNTVIVRQKISTPTTPIKQHALKKIQFLKTSLSEHIIKLNDIRQTNFEIALYYEYVPILLEPWISNINSTFIQSIKLQLGRVANFLAEHHIATTFKINKLGMNQKYQVKYFLGTDFEFQEQLPVKAIRFNYMNDIMELFTPYLYSHKPKVTKRSMVDQTPKHDDDTSQNRLHPVHHTPSHQNYKTQQNINSVLLKHKKTDKKGNMVQFLKKLKDFQEHNQIKHEKSNKINLGSSLKNLQDFLSPQKKKIPVQFKKSIPPIKNSSDEYYQYVASPRYKQYAVVKEYKTKRDEHSPISHQDEKYRLSHLNQEKYKAEIKDRVEKAINNSINAIKKYKIYTTLDQKLQENV